MLKLNSFDLTFKFCILLLVLLHKLKSVSSVSCRYYPFYPSSYTSYTTTCTYSCCYGYATTASSACCYVSLTTKYTYSYTSYGSDSWVVAVAIVGGLIGVCCIVGIAIGIACAVKNKKKRPTTIVPNWTNVAATSRYPATIGTQYQTPQPYANTGAYPGGPYPSYANPYGQLNPNPFNQFPSQQPLRSTPPKPSFSETKDGKYIDTPPRYDSLINQPATLNVENGTNNEQLPVLPATIGFNV